MERFDLSHIMKSAHRNFKRAKGGKTFSECLKAAWSLAKLQERFSPEAMKKNKERFLSEKHEEMSQASKATKHEGYNNLDIPSSAYYSGSKGRFGAHYVGD